MKNNYSHDIYERQAAIFKALANPTRLHLVELLGKRERWASELLEGLGISKANLSQHLSILKAAGVVSTQREGKELYCGIALPEIKTATTTVRNMTKTISRSQRRPAV
jgi:ArsR family transcriptional regulator